MAATKNGCFAGRFRQKRTVPASLRQNFLNFQLFWEEAISYFFRLGGGRQQEGANCEFLRGI